MTSAYPCSPSSAATSDAPFSCVSRTSAPPGRRAAAASRTRALGLPAVDERDVGLPVDDVPRQRRDLDGPDVRRVRHDQVPAFAGEPCEEIVAPELDVDTRALHVLAGEGERVLRHVDAGHAGPRVLVGDRERDRARPGADVEHARRVGAVQQRQAPLDDRLGLGTRDERPPVDGQREPAEAPLAEDVLERLARCPPCDERPRALRARLGSGDGRGACRARSGRLRERAPAGARHRAAAARTPSRRDARPSDAARRRS